jgi:glycosyltransferase involved in cell wall biosynthesis
MHARKMRILHAPFNIANIAWELSRAQRTLGLRSDAMQFFSNWIQYKCDINLNLETYRYPVNNIRVAMFFLKAITKYDIFHFHFGYTLLPKFYDVFLLKLLRKKVFFHYHGCDIKDRAYLLKKDVYSACHTCNPIRCNKNIPESKAIAKKYADGVFLGTPDLIEFYPQGVWLPPPIHIDEIEKAAEGIAVSESDTIKLLHAPSDPLLKGTEYVLRAVEELKEEGLPIELILVQNRPWQEAIKLFKTADIAIDQFRMGAYGHFAAECMALKKPVICYIREDVKKYYPDDLPIIISTGDTLAATIRTLIADMGKLKRIGNASYDYIKKYHDPDIVAQMTIRHYKNGMAK